jgi:hypothetical protein
MIHVRTTTSEKRLGRLKHPKTMANILSELASSTVSNLDSLIKPDRMGLLTDLFRLFTDNTMKCLSSNKGNRLELKPLSENEAELLSGNETELLSDNETKLLSDNRPQVLNGNSVKVASDVHLFSNINLNININVQNSGNKDSTVAAPDKVNSAFRRLDRDGDGKISPAEFRAGMKEK